MKQEYRDDYEMFLKEWGEESQIRLMLEEMSELSKELLKKLRLEKCDFNENIPKEKIEKNKQNILEEIADVLNMGEQLQYMFGEKEVDLIREQKMERTRKMIGGWKK